MGKEQSFVIENVRRLLLKEYLVRETKRAGFGGVEIQRTPMGTRVTLLTERPGLVIGHKGEAIKQLTKTVEEKFKYSNPQIEVKEVENPNLNPQIMAEKLAASLERGWHFRRAGHSTVMRIMAAGARGCRVIIAGKLTGERHRTEKFVGGTIKFCGDAALLYMKKGFAQAKLKPGIMGVTVEIMDSNAKLPDEVMIKAPEAPELPAVQPAVEPTPVPEQIQPTVALPSPPPTTITKIPAVVKKPKLKTKDLKKLVSEIKEMGAKVPIDIELAIGMEEENQAQAPVRESERKQETKKQPEE